MTDCPGQAVDHGFLFLVTVDVMVMPSVRMGITVGMIMGMGVVVLQSMIMFIDVVLIMGVDVVMLRPLLMVVAVSVRMPLLPVFCVIVEMIQVCPWLLLYISGLYIRKLPTVHIYNVFTVRLYSLRKKVTDSTVDMSSAIGNAHQISVTSPNVERKRATGISTTS